MMDSTSIASCYSPLDPLSRAIRLLFLSPNANTNDGRIQCSLVDTPLHEAPPFEALSYMWGEPDDLDLKIYLNGTLVTVRHNLWVALHYLRQNISCDRVLWIDALCIHQEDTKERNHQVGFMGEIYKQAEVVLAWLGAPPDAALQDETMLRLPMVYTRVPGGIFSRISERTRAFQHAASHQVPSARELNEPTAKNKRTPGIEAEAQASSSSKRAFNMLRAAAAGAGALNIVLETMVPIDRLDRWFMEFVQSPEFGAQWNLVLELCRVEYWNRLWVVQEIGLAKRVKVLYGNADCDWNDFSVPVSILSFWRDTFGQRFPDTTGRSLFLSLKESPAAKFVGRDFRRQGWMVLGEGLTYLLSISENSHCQERRDRIYALLGFLDKYERAQIPVDYSKSLYQIFEDVIKSSFYKQPYGPAKLVYFSEALQRALLAPLKKGSDVSHMFGNRTVFTLREAPRQGNHSDREYGTSQSQMLPGIRSMPSVLLPSCEQFELHAKILGPVGNVEITAGNIYDDKWDARVKRRLEDQEEPAQKRRDFGWRSDIHKLFPIQSLIQSPREAKLTDLWRADHQILMESKPAQPPNNSLGVRQTELTNKVALFEVTEPEQFFRGDGYLGVANSNIQNGDLLCIFPPSEITAIIRSCGADGGREDDEKSKDSLHRQHAQYSFIGRAIVSRGKARSDELVYGLSKQNWPPPDFSLGRTILDGDNSGAMAPPNSGTYSEKRISVKNARIRLTLKELQVLTCPLKRRTARSSVARTN